MTAANQGTVFVIDDDARMRAAMQRLLKLALCVVSLSPLLKLSLFLRAKCQPETRDTDHF